MANPVAAVKPQVELPSVVLSVKFAKHGRTGSKVAAVETVRAAKTTTLEEDPKGRGIWIDERILVPWANLLWVEYE